MEVDYKNARVCSWDPNGYTAGFVKLLNHFTNTRFFRRRPRAGGRRARPRDMHASGGEDRGSRNR